MVGCSGTLGQALSISKDDAYSAAQNIIRSRKDKLKWQLVKENKSAKLVWARMTMLDPREDKMAAQIVLAFDTQQVCFIIIRDRKKTTPWLITRPLFI